MATLRVRVDGKVREVDEDRLRKRLRSGSVTGRELVWREADHAWVPLRELALFAEEVPRVGDTLHASRRREAVGLAAHVVAFVTVTSAVCVHDGLAFAAVISGAWALVLFVHTSVSWPALRGLTASDVDVDDKVRSLPDVRPPPMIPQPKSAAQIAAALGAAPMPGGVIAAADGWIREFDAALRGLRAVLDDRRRDDPDAVIGLPDLDGIRDTAVRLHERARSLLPLCDPEARKRTGADHELAASRALTADEHLAVAHRAEAAAIAERLVAMEETARLVDELNSRKRGLMHQVEALRLILLRRDTGDRSSVDLADGIARMRRLVESEREVDEL